MTASARAEDRLPFAGGMNDVSVLVIDDDADICDTVRMVLEDAGHSVASAPDGGSALQLLGRIRPRMILLDLTMPGMDGASFRERQLSDEALAAIPTVVMTAQRNHGSAAGPLLVRASLAKPIDLDQLLALVDHYCESDRSSPAGSVSGVV